MLLALATGVTSAMFTVVDAFVFRPAPFRDPATLSQVAVRTDSGIGFYQNYGVARLWRSSAVFDSLSAAISAGGTLTLGNGQSLSVNTTWITPGSFEMVGGTPLLGRSFAPGDGRQGGDQYVILSETIWRDRLGGDADVVGTLVTVSDIRAIVVGVMPSSFRFPYRGDGIWRPFDLDQPPGELSKRSLAIFVRRPPGVPKQETARLARDVLGASARPETHVELYPVERGLLDRYSHDAIVALAVGVGLVFTVLCANVTNLILTRMSSRRLEFGVSAAIGASRGRLLRQVLFENVVIGLCAAVVGLALAYALVGATTRVLPAEFLRRTLNPLDLDVRAVLATALVGMTATLLAGLPAAMLGTGANPADSLRLGARTATDTRAGTLLTRGLLVTEVAMAVALLATGGLQARSFVKLATADRGVDSERVIAAQVSLPASHFADRAARSTFALNLAERLRGVPGVSDVALASALPPGGGDIYGGVAQADLPGAGALKASVNGYSVAPGFFRTLGIRVVEGRDFQVGDSATDVVISEGFGRALFGTVSPTGRSFTLSGQTYRVLGVAGEIRNPTSDPREDVPEFYQPLYSPGREGSAPTVPGSRNVTVAIRCGDPCASIQTLRDAISDESPTVTISSLRPLAESYLEELARPRLAAMTALGFAVLAFFASAVGLYGVFHYVVSRQKREMGIRSALGATPSALGRAIILSSLKVSVLGAVAGVGGAWILSTSLGAAWYGVRFADPLTWGAVLLLVLATAPIASWGPARQAMRIDPASLLRDPL